MHHLKMICMAPMRPFSSLLLFPYPCAMCCTVAHYIIVPNGEMHAGQLYSCALL